MRIIKDFNAFTKNDGLGKKIATLFLNPCFHCVCLYRLSNLFYRIHLFPIAKVIWYVNRIVYDVDIDCRADLAGGFHLIHGIGTVIGYNVISEGPLTIYQNVTLGGGNGRPGRIDEDGIVRGMPRFKDNCIVYTGAIVVGGIIVEDNSVIKAGSIITENYSVKRTINEK